MASSFDDPSSKDEEQPRETDPRDGDDASDEDDDKILERARAFFALSSEAWHEIRSLANEDIKFSAGDQWDLAIKTSRQSDARPCLTINRLPQVIQQVTNDQRQNRPSIKVHPVDDIADPETAKIQQGLIRHIEYNSSADAAYDTAFESASRGGFGFYRLIAQHCDPMSFDQDILIKRIPNQFSVFFDPHSVEPDGSDANEGGITEDLSKDEYKRLYPESQLSRMGEWEVVGNQYPDWMMGGLARVAEYFYKEYRTDTLVQLITGEIALESELPPGIPPAAIKTRRPTMIPTICWIKMNAVEILEKTTLPGSGRWIPIIPVFGNDLIVDGKRVLEGLIRHAKDPQRMLNYWKSAETEAIALAPKAPFIAAEGQIEGYEDIWKSANRANHSYLPYKPISLGGVAVPMPQRQSFEPAVQAITQAAMYAADDVKATTGIYDASLGAKSNETSGIAIQRRNNQSQTSNFHFIDNLTRSIKHGGRIIIDWMPDVYDSARTARIIGEDGTQQIVKLNQPHQDENGKDRLYDLRSGKYDVTVDVGPSFASKRQEAAASMMDFSKSVPQLAQGAADLIAKNMDWPGAPEIAERLKKMLPPGLADDPASKSQAIPPQVQAQMQQQAQLIKQLTDELHMAASPVELKRMELESRERIEFAKLNSNLELEMAKMGSEESMALLSNEIAGIKHRMSLINWEQPIDGSSNQDPGQPEAGAPMGLDPMGGAAQPMAQNPTGGEPPGSPMEGQPHP